MTIRVRPGESNALGASARACLTADDLSTLDQTDILGEVLATTKSRWGVLTVGINVTIQAAKVILNNSISQKLYYF